LSLKEGNKGCYGMFSMSLEASWFYDVLAKKSNPEMAALPAAAALRLPVPFTNVRPVSQCCKMDAFHNLSYLL
jgi:hypothetical protein